MTKEEGVRWFLRAGGLLVLALESGLIIALFCRGQRRDP